MPYGPHTADDPQRMLATIGVAASTSCSRTSRPQLRASPLRLARRSPS